MKNEESIVHNSQFTILNLQFSIYNSHFLVQSSFLNLQFYRFFILRNSYAPHGMKTIIFKILRKSYDKLYWNLYRIIIFVSFLKIFVRGKGEVLSCYDI